MEDEVWITKEGEKIPVKDLSEKYAKNIIRMLIRKQRNEKENLDSKIMVNHFDLEWWKD